MSGQSIQDRLTAARHSLVGQGLAKGVCKATTEEVMGPKKKHLDYLIQCTNEPNVSIPQLANLLIERTQHTNWVVVYKTLVTIHNLMNYGNERFTQYLASNNCTLQLSTFLDKTGVQGYDMSTYIRRYAKYLNEKAFSYRSMAYDFCKVKRGKDDGLLRTMDTEKLLKALPILQQQLDALLEFDVTANELANGVINACFMLLFKDLIRLFACYNDGIINLLELYFDMNKKNAKDALEIYKKFLTRMDRCSECLRVAEAVGIDKGDIPDLAKAPSSLLQALEEHLKSLDSNKKSKDRSKVTAAIQQLQSPTSPTSPPIPSSTTTPGSTISDEDKKKILEEESKQLETLKEQALRNKAQSPTGSTGTGATQPNPFMDNTDAAGGSLDLFTATSQSGGGATAAFDQNNDLLGLGLSGDNPFGGSADNNPFGTSMASAPPSSSPWGPTASTAPITNGTSTTNGGGGFISDDQFAKAFGNTTTTSGGGFDAFGDLLKPQNKSKGPPMASMASPSKQQQPQNIVKGDLDSSLANLAGNLSINGPASATKGNLNWNPVGSGEKKLTGGNTWAGPTPAFSTVTTAPMGHHHNNGYGGMPPGGYGHQPARMQYNGHAPGNWSGGMGQPSMAGFNRPMQPMMSGAPQQQQQQPAQQQQQANLLDDPFGAL